MFDVFTDEVFNSDDDEGRSDVIGADANDRDKTDADNVDILDSVVDDSSPIFDKDGDDNVDKDDKDVVGLLRNAYCHIGKLCKGLTLS